MIRNIIFSLLIGVILVTNSWAITTGAINATTITASTPIAVSSGGTGSSANANAANGVVVPTGAVNTANGAVILNGSGYLPALNGSLLTNLSSSWTNIATGSPTSVSGFSISSLSTGVRYKLILKMLQNTSNGYQYIQINGTSSTHKAAIVVGYNANAVGIGTSSGSLIPLTDINDVVPTTTYSYCEINFWGDASSNVLVFGNGVASENSIGAVATHNFAGTSAQSLSSIQIGTSAGTVSAVWALYQMN